MRETLLKLDDLYTLTGCKNLYYTGGCALNIHTNSAIVESRLFDHVFIPPCPDDSGLALGAAAFGEWKKGHKIQKHPPYLNNWGITGPSFDYSPEDVGHAAEMLVQGKVIGLCNGHGEAGPRALGNRSLLSLPSKQLAHKVSVEHKQREWYRPVAPVMLDKNTRHFTGNNTIHPLTRYMLLDVKIPEERQAEIAGTIHANGTARIQTLFSRDENPYLYDLLSLLDQKYGVKALVNTSFNSRGEPMVHTGSDALESARNMGIDAVVINGKVQTLAG